MNKIQILKSFFFSLSFLLHFSEIQWWSFRTFKASNYCFNFFLFLFHPSLIGYRVKLQTVSNLWRWKHFSFFCLHLFIVCVLSKLWRRLDDCVCVFSEFHIHNRMFFCGFTRFHWSFEIFNLFNSKYSIEDLIRMQSGNSNIEKSKRKEFPTFAFPRMFRSEKSWINMDCITLNDRDEFDLLFQKWCPQHLKLEQWLLFNQTIDYKRGNKFNECTIYA